MPSRDAAVHVEVAGTVFRLEGLRARARAWTSTRYRPFLTRKRADVTVLVRTAPAHQPEPLGSLALELVDGHFALKIGPGRADGLLPLRTVDLTVPRNVVPLNPTLFRFLCSFVLGERDAFLLHAAGVVDRRRGMLFCGPSNSGKTTIARLAGRRRVLNDDTVGVRRTPQSVFVCASPFFGDGGPAMAARNVCVPLRAVFFLRKATGFAHRRLRPAEVLTRALPQVFLPKHEPATVDRLLDALTDVAMRVPCFELSFTPRAELWEYIRGLV